MPATHQMSLFESTSPTESPDLSPEDWRALRKCAHVYRPRGQALEYSPLACNIYRGCSHSCAYCYAPSATQRTADEFHAATTRPANLLRRIRQDAEKYRRAGVSDPVLLCFTCDPYQPLDDEYGLTRQVIQILHSAGLPVQILTKGGKRALKDLDLLGPGDALAATLTLLDSTESALWEPNAAPPHERLQMLETAHAAGITTWASLEPVLDPEVALEIIAQTHAFVDLFKVGKLNYGERLPEYLRTRVEGIDWGQFARDVVNVLEGLGANYYIKKSLQKCLTP